MAFGDLCAACQLENTKIKCADLGESIDLEAAEKSGKDTYVDDSLTGGSKQQVEQMRGTFKDDGTYNGTIPRILAVGGLRVKAIIVLGERNEKAQEQLGN